MNKCIEMLMSIDVDMLKMHSSREDRRAVARDSPRVLRGARASRRPGAPAPRAGSALRAGAAEVLCRYSLPQH